MSNKKQHKKDIAKLENDLLVTSAMLHEALELLNDSNIDISKTKYLVKVDKLQIEKEYVYIDTWTTLANAAAY